MNLKYIKDKAKEINKRSLDFHLANCSLACERMIQDEIHIYLEKERNEIKKKKDAAHKRNDLKEIEHLAAREESLSKKRTIRIYIEYINGIGINEKSGRVVFFDNHFTINIPKTLLDKSVKENYEYTEYVKILRNIMAHELGHITLHWRELINLKGIQGSRSIIGEKDEEAKLFGESLLELRQKRNKAMIDNESLKNFFGLNAL